LAKAGGVGNHIDCADLSVRNCELEYNARLSAGGQCEADGPVEEGRLCGAGASGEGFGDGDRATYFARCAHLHGGTVGSDDDVWVEQCEKRVEVAAAKL
jgi:hypothetical protein